MLNRTLIRSLISFVLIAISFVLPTASLAGGGPENLVLVVNADSSSSKLIANHYIAGRKIPASHVIYLNGIPDHEFIKFDVFLESILKPVIEEIGQRKIAPSIDYIIYSADFPTVIDITDIQKQFLADMKKMNMTLPDHMFNPHASINALTYFTSLVMTGQHAFLRPDANTYFRNTAQVILAQPFVGQPQQQYDQAIQALKTGTEKEVQEAIQILEGLAVKNPFQVAVSYSLARLYAKSNNVQKATHWLMQAVRSGWCYREYTMDDTAFLLVRTDPVFKGVMQRIPERPFDFVPTQGFKHGYAWGVNGMINSEPGQGNQYFLSTVLASTRNHGNSEMEALQQLKITMKADSTFPRGTFYFTQTGDVRTRTRSEQFDSAMRALNALGQRSRVVQTDMPLQARDVLGLSSGIQEFNWLATGSKIVPGAICENLTSYGGVLTSDQQTKLTEFIKFNAAGSSGTVTEPFAVPFKFPHPMIHAHYASGCTLAEAYYQSVAGPFQLLIIGDPLCQPWAKLPEFNVTGISSGDTVSGTVDIKFEWLQDKVPIAGFEIYVDGIMVHRGPIRSKTGFDTTGIADGYHELRFVALADNPIQTTGRSIIPFVVNNHGQSVMLTASREKFLDTDTVRLKAVANQGDSIELQHNHRSLAKKIGREVEFEVPGKLLGVGPISITAISIDEETNQVVSSIPLNLTIDGHISERRRMTRQ
jgi:hypothetical protein